MLQALLFATVLRTSASIRVTPPDFPEAKEPQIALGVDGSCYVCYGVGGQIMISNSTNSGASFQSPTVVATPKNLSCGMRRGPRVAICGKAVVVSAVAGEKGAGDLLAWTSFDHGRTWSASARIDDVDGAAREGLHAMAANDKIVAAAWLDLRAKGTTIESSVSRDGGRTWSANRLVYESPGGSVCECCHPSIAFGPKGEMAVMWRNSLDGNRDLYYAISQDEGKTFSSASKLGVGSWPLNACPMDGGSLAFLGDGTIQSVWRRGMTIFSCQPGEPEKELGSGEQAWMASSGKDPVYVWLEHRGAALWSKSGSQPPIRLASSAMDPVVASASGSKAPVVASWTESGVVYSQRLN